MTVIVWRTQIGPSGQLTQPIDPLKLLLDWPISIIDPDEPIVWQLDCGQARLIYWRVLLMTVIIIVIGQLVLYDPVLLLLLDVID